MKINENLNILNTPEAVVSEYLRAWQSRNPAVFVLCLQRSIAPFFPLYRFCAMIMDGAKDGKPPIISYEVGTAYMPERDTSSAIQRDVPVKIDFGHGLHDYVLVTNCEIKDERVSYRPSPAGLWGVNPNSLRKIVDNEGIN